MSRLQILNAKKMEKALFYQGFVKVRQNGSHVFYRHPDGRTTTVPHHAGRDLSRPLLRSILSDIRISIEEFNKILLDV